MKTKKYFIFSLLILASCISGCSPENEPLPDTYVEGSDHQYMYMGGFDFYPNFQKGEQGYYFRYNNFIYFFDDKEETIVPLCSKADCLHDKETDQEKLESCNAYAGTNYDTGLAYCNGYLYYIDPDFTQANPTLYRFAADGSMKEKLYEWDDDDIAIQQWIVHRDVLYYMVQSFSTGEEDVGQFNAVYALPLTGRSRLKPIQIYTPEDGIEVFTLGNPTAYGNYMYFTLMGNLEGWDGSDETWQEYDYTKTFVYDIRAEELRELRIPGQSNTTAITGVKFWKDHLILTPFDSSKAYLEDSDCYLSDLDGSNSEPLMTSKQGYSLFCDENYLYISNVGLVQVGHDNGPKLYHIYDNELNEIDTFTTASNFTYDFPIGDCDRAYVIYYKENGEWGLEYWDKSEIGTLDGAEIEFTMIPYEGSVQK